ncbi:Murein DD-endopeptidase MepM and murein hydrolase activator NlpD, contain LysM domain [Epsilonproteobacteria bacterium SCGC AD-308-P11]|nr:Murein DD-endopeptidase MepM and murein hydrolase activator NlpD, contain LysM domain [Epsilonproteobacteria bacterium SCGC AD-308-P11]
MNNRNGKSSFGVLASLGLIIAASLYVYTASMFERDVPKITFENNGYWNLKAPLDISIDDASGIKSYKVTFKSPNNETTLNNEQFIELKESIGVKVMPPRTSSAIKDKDITIVVEALDASKWNFLKGNSVTKEFHLKIDKERPKLNIISNTYKITKGGSALVIFKASDDNLKDIYIETDFKKQFKAEPFYKPGYYISLLAWPVTEANFKATIVVTDEAGNNAKSYVPLYLKDKEYKISNIAITDKFLKGKIAELAGDFDETQGVDDPIKQFKLINEDVRVKNEQLIYKITSQVSNEMISDFKINTMYPLKNAKVVAQFGDRRKYTYEGNALSESYHLGLDLASNAQSEIKPQNGGDVVFADFNGLYGNMPIISHGLGLYTLYGHCSNLLVSNGDKVSKGEHIANTGKTGYAMGDHLHFGVLVQGIEVRPQEWMDKQWIQLNIYDVINSAKKTIDKT